MAAALAGLVSGRRLLIGLVLMSGLIGLGLVGQGGYIHAKAWAAQRLIATAWTRRIAGETEAKPWPWADTWPVARLRVPRLDADLIVLASASGQSLAFGPGHLSQTAQPNGPGIAVVAGHRDTHFRFLGDLRPGDRIDVTSADGLTRTYRFAYDQVLTEDRVRLTHSLGVPTLVLSTCWPLDGVVPGGPERLLIIAVAEPGISRQSAYYYSRDGEFRENERAL